jgi:hypothetical protein
MMLYKIISEFFAPNSLLTPSRYWRYPITRKGVHSPFLCGGWRRESNSTGLEKEDRRFLFRGMSGNILYNFF